MAGIAQADYLFATDCENQPLNSVFSPADEGSIQPVRITQIGNPGICYQFRANWGVRPFEARVFFTFNSWQIYQNSMDYVSSIDVKADFRTKTGNQDLIIFLNQNFKSYIARIPTSTLPLDSWHTASLHLTSDDFENTTQPEESRNYLPEIGYLDSASHPNFGPQGGPITLAIGSYLFSKEITQAGSSILSCDNISFHVRTDSDSASALSQLLGLHQPL